MKRLSSSGRRLDIKLVHQSGRRRMNFRRASGGASDVHQSYTTQWTCVAAGTELQDCGEIGAWQGFKFHN